MSAPTPPITDTASRPNSTHARSATSSAWVVVRWLELRCKTSRVLQSISATSFKSWADLGQLQLAPVTGFFGTNSSGKTSLLQLLLLMKQTVLGSDRRQVLNLGGDDRSFASLGLPRDVFHRHDLETEMILGYSWRPEHGLSVPDPTTEGVELFAAETVSFQTTLAVREEQLYVEDFRYSLDNNIVQMTQSTGPKVRRAPEEYELAANIRGNPNYLRKVTGRSWPLPRPVKCYGFPDEAVGYFQNSGFLSVIELELEQQFGDRLSYLGPLRSYPLREYHWQGHRPEDVGQRGERSVEALLASRSRGRTNTRKRNKLGRAIRLITVEEHVAGWLAELDLIADFEVQRISQETNLYRVVVEPYGSDVPVLLTDVGFGVSQILPVLVLLAYVPEGSTVLLEQPEIHLHPAVQARLADVILETARTRGVQVIVESHSEHLLRRLQRRVAEGEVAPDEVALYFCDYDGTESRAERLELNLLGEIENWPEGFFGNPFEETAAIVSAGLGRGGPDAQ
ncbi:MAG: DUF3696 domain-containing protein [bacterium]|nr:DUF3696 domain-containing protein [bacterium]